MWGSKIKNSFHWHNSSCWQKRHFQNNMLPSHKIWMQFIKKASALETLEIAVNQRSCDNSLHYNENNLWLHTGLSIACFSQETACSCLYRHIIDICRKNEQSWIWTQNLAIKVGLTIALAPTPIKTLCGRRIWFNLTPTPIGFAWRRSCQNTMFANIWSYC